LSAVRKHTKVSFVLVVTVPARGRGVGTRSSLRFLPTLTILWFYSMILWLQLFSSVPLK